MGHDQLNTLRGCLVLGPKKPSQNLTRPENFSIIYFETKFVLTREICQWSATVNNQSWRLLTTPMGEVSSNHCMHVDENLKVIKLQMLMSTKPCI